MKKNICRVIVVVALLVMFTGASYYNYTQTDEYIVKQYCEENDRTFVSCGDREDGYIAYSSIDNYTGHQWSGYVLASYAEYVAEN